jgi:hypothetical protein
MANLLTPALLDPSSDESAFDWDAVQAEFVQRQMWSKAAELYELIDRAMTRVERVPEIFVNASSMTPGAALEFARRSALLDIAIRLRLSEMTVGNRWFTARLLKERTPRLWTHFRDGEVSEAHVRAASEAVKDLPRAAWADLDEALSAARDLTGAKFKVKARVLRERLHPESMSERHQRALADRTVEFQPGADGMGWLTIADSSAELALAKARIDDIAYGLFRAKDEDRTLAQIRADVATGLLTGTITGDRAGIQLVLTVPVLSLLDQSAELPTLEGVGPIDLETAKRLAGTAKSYVRVLTDPVKGTVLDIDRDAYRVPTAMRRWLATRDVTCTTPGCNRLAKYCEVDHVEQFNGGFQGKTEVRNLAHLCKKHHRLKHNSKWRVERKAGGITTWTSPTGTTALPDEPPF